MIKFDLDNGLNVGENNRVMGMGILAMFATMHTRVES